MTSITVREAKVSDCESLVALMKDSAEEMKMGTVARLTAKDLEWDAFGDSPIFTIYVGQIQEGLVVGYVLFYFAYSTFEGRCVCIEELYVLHSFRRKGLATALWKKVNQTALEHDCKRCNLTALPGNQFLLSQGAVDLTLLENWLFFRQERKALDAFLKDCKCPDGVEIRESRRNDCITIRKLIQDLADYEKMPDGPKMDAATLEEDGHGNIRFQRCFVAEAGGVIVGYSIYFFTYNAEGHGVYMEDLYVSPEHRGKGIGKALWGCVIKAGVDIGGNRCDFAVLDWNTPSIDFYKIKGAVDMTNSKNYHFYRMTREIMEQYIKK